MSGEGSPPRDVGIIPKGMLYCTLQYTVSSIWHGLQSHEKTKLHPRNHIFLLYGWTKGWWALGEEAAEEIYLIKDCIIYPNV